MHLYEWKSGESMGKESIMKNIWKKEEYKQIKNILKNLI